MTDRVRWELVALAPQGQLALPLPEAAAVVVGRAGDLAIEEPSVSRRHASFALENGQVVVTDLGSANGSRIVEVVADAQRTAETRATPLVPNQPTPVPLAASVTLGEVTVLVRRADARIEPDVIAHAPAMRRAIELVERLAQAPLSVLLVGETGVGKDVMARVLHAASPRAKGPFVAINCAALSEALVESELFGHEKGAFTGAVTAKTGLLEAAAGGTVFLDEIGELPLPQQSKLLRALETREVTRVGAVTSRAIDVRFVSATNRNPAREEDGFRRDLYFRLSGMTVTIPPLRERSEDLEPLAVMFAKKAADALGRPAPRLAPEAIARLRRHAFPGNLRELRNVIDRAVTLATGVIQAEHLHLEEGAPAVDEERRRIEDALAECAGNQTRAAELLGISRRTLVSRLREYGIARPRADR